MSVQIQLSPPSVSPPLLGVGHPHTTQQYVTGVEHPAYELIEMYIKTFCRVDGTYAGRLANGTVVDAKTPRAFLALARAFLPVEWLREWVVDRKHAMGWVLVERPVGRSQPKIADPLAPWSAHWVKEENRAQIV